MVRARVGAAVGLQDLLPRQVLRRFVEQINKEKIFKVFSQDLWVVFSSSTALRGAEPRCAGRVSLFSDVIFLFVTLMEIWTSFL